MIFSKEFTEYGYTDLVAYSGKDITDDMLAACSIIQKKFFDAEYTVYTDNLLECVKKYNQMCFVFVDKVKNAVVGYSFWFPIKTPVFNAFIKNNFTLLELRSNFFSNYKDPTINLFLASEAYVLGYDIKRLHEAVEDIFSRRILDLAYNGTKVKYIAMEAVCDYDEKFLAKLLGLTNKIKKDKSTFYYGEYSPENVYKSSKYASGIKQYYAKLKVSAESKKNTDKK